MPKILVVDDDMEIRQLAGKYLSERGHEVNYAKDAFEAKDFLDKYSSDLILLDVNMPQKDGFTLLGEIRSSTRFKNIPIIMLTARNEKNDIQKALMVGANHFIIKPFKHDDLVDYVDKFIPKSAWDRLETVTFQEADNKEKSTCLILTEFNLVSLSELTLAIQTQNHISEGLLVEVQSPLFKNNKIEKIIYRVLSCESKGKNEFQVFLLIKSKQKEVQDKIKDLIKRRLHLSA